MLSQEIILTTIQNIVSDVLAIYLFGSTNTIYETSESDVDIAILTHRKITFDAQLHLVNQLIDALHKDKIDLIDLRQVSTVLKFQIIFYGKRIYCANAYLCDSFEMYTFSDYVRLNEARRNILRDIQERGSVL